MTKIVDIFFGANESVSSYAFHSLMQDVLRKSSKTGYGTNAYVYE